jgi:hypothetical protein
VLAHQAQDALPAHREASMGEAGPDLPVALAVEHARREDGADPRHELGVGPAGLRAPLPGRARRRPGALGGDTLDRGIRNTWQMSASGYRRPVLGLTCALIPCASSTRP